MLCSIQGFAGVGKDEVSKIIQEYLPEKKFKVLKWSKKLKEIASMLTGVPIEMWESQKFKASNLGPEWNREGLDCYLEGVPIPMTGRQFLQALGEGLRSQLHKAIWVNSLLPEIDSTENCLLTDTRYKNEAKAIKDRRGVFIRVINPRINNADMHISEQELINYPVDFEIINDGTIEELRQKVLVILKELKLC